VLTTGDTQTGNPSTFNDTGLVLVSNGYDGVSLPSTLTGFVNEPGGASFNLVSATNAAGPAIGSGGNGAYWNVELTCSSGCTTNGQTAIVNAFGINALGANNFSATGGGTAYLYGGTSTNIFGSWATVEGTQVDGLDLGSWTLTGLTISVGGWGSGTGAATDDISSITLPGTPVAATPLPATLPLFIGGLGMIAMISGRRRRKAIPA